MHQLWLVKGRLVRALQKFSSASSNPPLVFRSPSIGSSPVHVQHLVPPLSVDRAFPSDSRAPTKSLRLQAPFTISFLGGALRLLSGKRNRSPLIPYLVAMRVPAPRPGRISEFDSGRDWRGPSRGVLEWRPMPTFPFSL